MTSRTQVFALAALAAVHLSALPARAEEHPTYGKTYAQILKMGDSTWMDYHAGKSGGSSTAEINEAMGIYRLALRWRNDRLAPRAPASVRTNVAKLRPLLGSFVNSMNDVGFYNSGGGTIWSNIGASAHAGAEETLYHLLGGPGRRGAPLKTGAVYRALDRLPARMDEARKDFPATPEQRQDALKSLSDGRATFDKIVKIAARLDRRGSDEVLGFCLEQAKQADGKLGGN